MTSVNKGQNANLKALDKFMPDHSHTTSSNFTNIVMSIILYSQNACMFISVTYHAYNFDPQVVVNLFVPTANISMCRDETDDLVMRIPASIFDLLVEIPPVLSSL